MKKLKYYFRILFITFFCLGGFLNIWAQKNVYNTREFNSLRAYNVVEAALGASVPNADYAHPMFDVSMRVGYKRYITHHLNVNVSFNKFNLVFKDVFNEGFMSFDINIESTLLPYNRFSPFIFFGGSVHASNYFEKSDAKLQGGLGVEYLIRNRVGIKVFSDYNYVFSDEVDGRIYGKSDDVYWRMALGLNFYFGGSKRKVKSKKKGPTIINSNQIINHK
ncbi:MAG: Curli production assembly/transport component CsgG [Xanthomarina sp.]